MAKYADNFVQVLNSFLHDQQTFMTMLHNHGYYTGYIGKWHLGKGHEPKPGYDYWVGSKWLGTYFEPESTMNGETKRFSGFTDDVIADLAADFVREHSQEEQPFCLYVGLKAPHLPYSFPERLTNTYDGVSIPKPASYDEDIDYEEAGKPGLVNSTIRLKHFKAGLPMFQNSWDQYIKSYYRSALSINDSVKTILDAVDNAGISDDTIVIYTSDQGYHNGEHGLTEKHYAYEDVMRIPLLMRYPRLIEKGVRNQELVNTLDIAPTLLDVCGCPISEELPGKSWQPLFTGSPDGEKPFRQDTFFSFVHHPSNKIQGCVAVRTERHKLIS